MDINKLKTALKARNDNAKFNLPVDYRKITQEQRRRVREQYIEDQKGLCFWCKISLKECSPLTDKKINWKLFPPNFLDYPIHLQHDHGTGMTEGAVHAYCNAVMWQYHRR